MPNIATETWGRLRATGEGDGKLEVASLSTGIETGYGPALYAIGPSGEPRLLVPFGPGAVPKDLGSGPNLIAGVSKFSANGQSSDFLDVMVTDRRLDKVFAELVGEILIRLGDGQPPARSVSSTISDFRKLLMGHHQTAVSIGKLMGLIGELYVLKRLVEIDPNALAAWTGPFGQSHDFRRNVHALEVKTSGKSEAHQLTINGFQQLHPPTDGTLRLAHVRIERAGGGALSVCTLRRDILEAGAEEFTLDAALKELGCDDPDGEAWNGTKFNFEGLDLYRVEPGFPRLTPTEFAAGTYPEGISSITYDISLAKARDFLIPWDQIPGELKGFLQ